MEKFNQENSDLIHKKLSKLGMAYDPNFDIIQNQPNVNWVDVELMACVNLLLKRIEDLEWEVLSLQDQNKSQKIDPITNIDKSTVL